MQQRQRTSLFLEEENRLTYIVIMGIESNLQQENKRQMPRPCTCRHCRSHKQSTASRWSCLPGLRSPTLAVLLNRRKVAVETVAFSSKTVTDGAHVSTPLPPAWCQALASSLRRLTLLFRYDYQGTEIESGRKQSNYKVAACQA